MSIFDKPGGTELLRDWNNACETRAKAKEEAEKARLRSWECLVRMAEIHKRAEDMGEKLLWIEEIDGDRDQILLAAKATGSEQ